MANFIEKKLPKKIREKMSTLIVTALGLFLALQYNETMESLFKEIFPLDGSSLFVRIAYIVVLTVIIVYSIILVERGLDGK